MRHVQPVEREALEELQHEYRKDGAGEWIEIVGRHVPGHVGVAEWPGAVVAAGGRPDIVIDALPVGEEVYVFVGDEVELRDRRDVARQLAILLIHHNLSAFR